jgi:sigma-B regulation protein RsbU (phosphoserine phosphatase)
LEIVAFHSINSYEESALGMVLPLEGNSSSQEVLRTKKTIVIQDTQSNSGTEFVQEVSKERRTKAIMIVPLLARGRAIGTIGMPANDDTHVFSGSEIELAETLSSQIAAAVDNARLHSQTEVALDVVERDLEIGRQIQSGFFPESFPVIPGWEIAAHFQAARQVAGDFYDIFQFKSSDFTAFIIADVCDKGVGAALFMVLFRSLLRAFSEAEINEKNVQTRLKEIILNTNNFIAEIHGQSNMFATLFFGVLDPDSGTLHYINGGHEPPVLLNDNGEIVQRLMPTGPAVGLFPDMGFEVEQVQFDKGDSLVGFTDGITDAKNSAGELFTEKCFLENIQSTWTSAFSMVFELSTVLQKHIGGQDQFDDITLISLRRKRSPKVDNHAICRVADISVFSELRDFVEAAATNSGLSHEDAFSFKLAAEEICTNIIQYGYQEGEPGFIVVSFECENDIAKLTIEDQGKHFPPEQVHAPDIETDWEERQIGGLGIYIVKELMDNVSYNKNKDKGNILVLEKKLATTNS